MANDFTACLKEATNLLPDDLTYQYDPAGNLNVRSSTKDFGQSFGGNSLNKLTFASRSGTLMVMSANVSSVTVNGGTASRYADATFAATGFTLTNGNNSFTAIASDSLGRNATETVSVNLPVSRAFSYDLNWNMTISWPRCLKISAWSK